MLFLAPTWQQMLATLPPDEQAEILVAIAGRGEKRAAAAETSGPGAATTARPGHQRP